MSKAFKVWARVMAVALAVVATLSIHTRTAMAEDTVECPIGEVTTYVYESSVYPLEFTTDANECYYIHVPEWMSIDDTHYYYTVIIVPKPNSLGMGSEVWAYDPQTQTYDGSFAIRAVPQIETLDVCVGQSVDVDLTGYSYYDEPGQDPIDSIAVTAPPHMIPGVFNCVLDSYELINSPIDEYDGWGFYKYVHRASLRFPVIGGEDVCLCAATGAEHRLYMKRLNVTVHDHAYDEGTVISEPTCTAEGTLEKTCTHCGSKLQVPIEMAAHQWSTEYSVDQEPTCAAEGKESLHCVVCGAVNADSTVSIPTTDHSWDEGVVTTDATYDAEGVRTYTCTVCGAERTEAIPALSRTSLEGATVIVGEQTYTGSALKPVPVVKVGGKTLKSGPDFTVSYENNVKVGTATVTVKGKGDYQGSVSANFKIVRASVAKATVSKIANQKYDGNAKGPTPTVKVGGRTLKKGTDYTLSYKNNQRPGTATVTITGKGNYTGSKSVTFKIVVTAGAWKKSGSRWWYQWKDGDYPKSVFLDISGKTYYFDASGWMVTGWKQIGGKWYCFGSDGAMRKNAWAGNYWLGSDGVMVTSDWVDGGRYHVDRNGKWDNSR